jgi:hypothetical protein
MLAQIAAQKEQDRIAAEQAEAAKEQAANDAEAKRIEIEKQATNERVADETANTPSPLFFPDVVNAGVEAGSQFPGFVADAAKNFPGTVKTMFSGSSPFGTGGSGQGTAPTPEAPEGYLYNESGELVPNWGHPMWANADGHGSPVSGMNTD